MIQLMGLELKRLRMGKVLKSWGVVFITIIGFVVGVVLAGVGGLTARTNLTFSRSEAQSKTNLKSPKKLEQYWQESGLGLRELQELVSNDNCHTSEKYFLSCINSVVQPLDTQKKYLSHLTGEIESLARKNDDSELTEKIRLQPYLQMYASQTNRLINFDKVWSEILRNTEKKKYSSVLAQGINGFLSVYKDPHTYILPENYYDEVASLLDRNVYFVGVTFEKQKGQTIVRKVFKNSDAAVAGLKAYDRLLEINGQNTTDLSLLEISQILRDQKMTEFDFKIRRDNKSLSLKIKRRYQQLSHVQFEILKGVQKNMALLTITKFNRGVCQETATKIKAAANENISGLVLDLRDNPGGQLDEAACLTGLFIGMNRKTYSVEFFDPLRSSEVVLSTGTLTYSGPLVAIINNSSASASELLAGALKDYKRALLVGEKTFGKGTFQEAEEWSKNKKVSLFKTQGFYLLPSDRSPQLVGIEPDFTVDEGHVKLREDSVYFNPLEYNYRKVIPNLGPSFNMVKLQENLENCLQYSNGIVVEDLALQKALQILSCHRITSTLAQEYNPHEYSN